MQIVRGILYLFFGLISILVVVFGVFAYSATGASNNFDGCQTRVLENRLDGRSAIDFTDRCMGSMGYHKTSGCFQELYPVAGCYVPRWIFWVK